jgi:GTPase SAR1 family protein
VWWKQATDYGVGSVPAVLVGNKTDLKSQVQVIKPAALGMAKTLGEIPYIETSAKTGDSVDAAFVKLCELMQAAYEQSISFQTRINITFILPKRYTLNLVPFPQSCVFFHDRSIHCEVFQSP